jgi:hypothetical protein
MIERFSSSSSSLLLSRFSALAQGWHYCADAAHGRLGRRADRVAVWVGHTISLFLLRERTPRLDHLSCRHATAASASARSALSPSAAAPPEAAPATTKAESPRGRSSPTKWRRRRPAAKSEASRSRSGCGCAKRRSWGRADGSEAAEGRAALRRATCRTRMISSPAAAGSLSKARMPQHASKAAPAPRR